MSRYIFLFIGLATIFKLHSYGDLEATLSGVGSIALLTSMVWFTDFWTGTLMSFGWLESLSKDFKNPSASNPALILMAWILLLLEAGFVFFG